MWGRKHPARTGVILLVLLASCLWSAFVATAEETRPLKGVALVLGEGGYESLPPLSNPVRDARAFDDLLAKLGFKTDLVTDKTGRQLRRAIDGFIDDAEGADVALVYYSGHGIEAGGVNYLVPIDAGPATLDAADEGFISLQDIHDRLRSKARVTILLLDACRNSPFPAGAMLRRNSGSTSVPVAASGLGTPRGVTVIEDQAAPANADSIGEIIGFAAEPGQAALDGPADSNSPYMAALLKHLSANQGYEFSQVMTMVTEEVYLASGARQRPWTNASLRRFLTFGGTVESASTDDALIEGERRKLLLTIAATPQEARNFVESLAKEQKLPLDLVYGMLKELQVDTGAGTEGFEKQLRDGVEQAKRFRAERDALRLSDPEIIALSKLADRAEAEGALALARTYWAKASLRADEEARNRERNKTDVMDRAREAASVYAHHAEAAALTFDYEIAMREFAKAYKEVEWFDPKLALKYKIGEANAQRDVGFHEKIAMSLRDAFEGYRTALRLVSRDSDPAIWATVQDNLGAALRMAAQYEAGEDWQAREIPAYVVDMLEKSIAAHEAALAVRSREQMPLDWATSQSNLGSAWQALGEFKRDANALRKAVTAYQAAFEVRSRDQAPMAWAETQGGLALALWKLGELQNSTETLRSAVTAYEAALSAETRARSPVAWAMMQDDLGALWKAIGKREGSVEALEKSVTAYEAALGEWAAQKERPQPSLSAFDRWEATQLGIANALQVIGEHENEPEALRKAIAIYSWQIPLYEKTSEAVRMAHVALRLLETRIDDREAFKESIMDYEKLLEARRRDQAPLDWAMTQRNLGLALLTLGQGESGTDTLKRAVAAYEAALTVWTRERVPRDWARTQRYLAATFLLIGERETGADALRKTIAIHQNLLAGPDGSSTPNDKRAFRYALALAYMMLSEREGGILVLEQTLQALRAAEQDYDRQTSPSTWAYLRNLIGYSLTLLGERAGDARRFAEAVPLLREALEEQTRLSDPLSYNTADSLCRALLGLGASSKNRNLLVEAKALCLTALKSEKEHKNDKAVRDTEASLSRIEKALAAAD